jgi:trans-2,3-dihydro-3-hydroxyanthranilate isomerase
MIFHAFSMPPGYPACFVRNQVTSVILPILPALGLHAGTLAPGACVASLGRPRLLVPVPAGFSLAALALDPDRLRDACDRLGLLGCYVHSVPTADRHLAARMFAPSIGVAEDIANANSTACLAAHLARRGHHQHQRRHG